MTTHDPLQKTTPAVKTSEPVLLRKCGCGGTCGPCGKDKRREVQRSHVPGSEVESVPPIVHDVLRSSGRPLDASARAFFEPRFGADFSGVRVHTDARAAESAQAVSARAYTVGSSIVFGESSYAPHTGEGRQLLAHELTHVIQQSGVAAGGPLRISDPSEESEREADEIGGAA